MKKLALLLVALLVASPALGALEITCTNVGYHVTLGYTGAGTDPATRVRGFGLDIDSGVATISNVTTANTDYYIYPGTILIDGDGVVTYDGTPNAPEDAPGEKDPGITIEMASLWATNDTNGHTTPPPTSGTLVEFDVSGDCTLTVSANTLRTGIILEDGSVVTANLPKVLVISETPPPTYTLSTAVVGNGSVTGAGTYDENEVVPVEAIPDALWQFKEWSGDLGGSTNPTTILMDGNKSITATFVDDCFPLSFTTYNDWVTLGKPLCWCNSANGGTGDYQCDGDSMLGTETWANYRIYVNDYLEVVHVNNWKQKIDSVTLNPCADIDHLDETWANYRVYVDDYLTVTGNWKKKDGDLGGDCGLLSRPE